MTGVRVECLGYGVPKHCCHYNLAIARSYILPASCADRSHSYHLFPLSSPVTAP